MNLMGQCFVWTASGIRLSEPMQRDDASCLAALTRQEHPEWGQILVLQVVERYGDLEEEQ